MQTHLGPTHHHNLRIGTSRGVIGQSGPSVRNALLDGLAAVAARGGRVLDVGDSTAARQALTDRRGDGSLDAGVGLAVADRGEDLDFVALCHGSRRGRYEKDC